MTQAQANELKAGDKVVRTSTGRTLVVLPNKRGGLRAYHFQMQDTGRFGVIESAYGGGYSLDAEKFEAAQ